MIEIDGIDNGVVPTKGGEFNYKINTNISNDVREINSKAEEGSNYIDEFQEALIMVKSRFIKKVKVLYKELSQAKELKNHIKEAIVNRFNFHKSGKILFTKNCLFAQDIFSLEKELDIKDEILFVIQPELKGTNFRIFAVPIQFQSFESRKPLKHGGLKEKELCDTYNVEGCVFVHVNGFTGGNKTKEGAIKMVEFNL